MTSWRYITIDNVNEAAAFIIAATLMKPIRHWLVVDLPVLFGYVGIVTRTAVTDYYMLLRRLH